jgi:hypothetical protein
MNQSLPVRVRSRTEVAARILTEYVARATRQRIVLKGPGSNTSGGATIRPPWCATLHSWAKRWSVRGRLLLGISGYLRGSIGVIGDIAWRKWCMY